MCKLFYLLKITLVFKTLNKRLNHIIPITLTVIIIVSITWLSNFCKIIFLRYFIWNLLYYLAMKIKKAVIRINVLSAWSIFLSKKDYRKRLNAKSTDNETNIFGIFSAGLVLFNFSISYSSRKPRETYHGE